MTQQTPQSASSGELLPAKKAAARYFDEVLRVVPGFQPAQEALRRIQEFK